LLQTLNRDLTKRSVKATLFVLTAALAILTGNYLMVSSLILLHFWAACIMTDLLALLTKLIFKRRAGIFWKILHVIYRYSIPPLLVTALVLWYGAWNMARVRETRYIWETELPVRGYRVALLSDLHFGTVQDPDVLKNAIPRINATEPDLVILDGDIVEDSTTFEQMQEVFQLLSGLQSTFGTYYIYGNHDTQPYASTRSYTNEQLEQTITDNGIHILQDEYIRIGEDLILAGRDDAAWSNPNGRKSIEELLEGVDPDELILVADHQPVEAEEISQAGADILVSGHTHAGQIWPGRIALRLLGILSYGHYPVDSCDVYVSSGFAGWGYPIRTSEHCEYVLLDIVPSSAAAS